MLLFYHKGCSSGHSLIMISVTPFLVTKRRLGEENLPGKQAQEADSVRGAKLRRVGTSTSMRLHASDAAIVTETVISNFLGEKKKHWP